MMTTDHLVGDDLEISRISRRVAAGGTWVSGRLAGHRFEALVFPAHADNADWELGQSRISKLWVERLADRTLVFNWDRGPDVQAADGTAEAIVEFLAEGLTDFIHAA